MKLVSTNPDGSQARRPGRKAPARDSGALPGHDAELNGIYLCQIMTDSYETSTRKRKFNGGIQYCSNDPTDVYFSREIQSRLKTGVVPPSSLKAVPIIVILFKNFLLTLYENVYVLATAPGHKLAS